ncbi:MAG TPA: hypothetical protein VK933_04445 [Longimicrobiales bacterium]|nr:hypothetical protein [Longimicrobiales bacterium]
MNNINFRSPLAVLLMAGVVGACDNPVSHEEDHAEPDGMVLRASGTEVVRIGDDGVTGALTVAVGTQSPELTVTFIDHEGSDVALDPHEYWVEVTPANSATATWQGTAAEGFTGRVTGHAAGATTLTFVLHHGAVGSGHAEPGAEFVVPLTVTATQQ